MLDRLKSQGFEVLFALDQIDEIALQGVGNFMDYEVVDAAKENADLGETSEEEKEAEEKAKEEIKDTTEFLKTTLGARVDKVAVSARLETSPSALVQPQWGMSPQMQRFMKAQAAAAGDDLGAMGGMASNLEINPKHEVVLKLKEMVAAGDAQQPTAAAYAELLYDVAAVSSGYELGDTAAFAKRVVALMSGGDDALAALADEAASAEEAPVDEAKTEDDDDKGEDEDTPVPTEVV